MSLVPADPARVSAKAPSAGPPLSATPAPPSPGAAAASLRAPVGLERVLVVVPAHDEEASLPATLAAVRAHLPGAAIVVVDDCSADRSAEIAARAGADVVTLPCNLGYGGAVQAGFKYALARGFEVVLQLDADGQHDPASAAALLAPVLQGEVEVAIGSRFLGHARYPIPALRRFGMRVFARIVSFVARQRFSDPTSGYQALGARAIAFFAHDNYPSDFPDADTIILLVLAGFRVREIPVVMRARSAGSSMHSNLGAIYYVSKMFLSITMVMLRRRMFRART
jgi:glycosyltransferase involved in cell wall biosynthesis